MDTMRHITTTEGKAVGETMIVSIPIMINKVVVIMMSLVRSMMLAATRLAVSSWSTATPILASKILLLPQRAEVALS